MSRSSHNHNEPHAAPLWVLVAVCVSLMILTYLTVTATYIDLGGEGNLFLAMGIATLKASLVVLFFMHLFWDKPVNSFVFIASLIFVTLFIVFALMDTLQYQPIMIENYAPLINK